MTVWQPIGQVQLEVAVVKPVVDDKKTKGIIFIQDGDLEGELRAIETRIRKNWDVKDVFLLRRLGKLYIGDVVLVVIISAQKSMDAFGACQEALEQLKQKRALRKQELFT